MLIIVLGANLIYSSLARNLTRLLPYLHHGSLCSNNCQMYVYSTRRHIRIATNELLDLRRYVRPLFLSPDGTTPGPYKRLYDISGIILTQLTFAYITTPFIILDLKESFIFWTRTYFYGHIGIAFLYFYFHSPYGRGVLIKLQKARVAKFTQTKEKEAVAEEKAMEAIKDKINRYNVSAMNVNEPGPLGLPEDVERDVIEAGRKELDEVDWKKAQELLRGMRNRKAQETGGG